MNYFKWHARIWKRTLCVFDKPKMERIVDIIDEPKRATLDEIRFLAQEVAQEREQMEGTWFPLIRSVKRENMELLRKVERLEKGLFDPIRDEKLEMIRRSCFSINDVDLDVLELVKQVYHLRAENERLRKGEGT